MRSVINLYKPPGMTPLECVRLFCMKHPEYSNQALGYAGRLDPMAEGVLLVLVGLQNKKRKEYEKLPKTYECEVLFGVNTDTYDALGLIIHSKNTIPPEIFMQSRGVVQKLAGKHMQPYPPYSSPRVKGRPLFYWAREGKIDSISIPEKEIEIFHAVVRREEWIAKEILQERIYHNVGQVVGNFRQGKIIPLWKRYFETTSLKHFPIQTLTLSVSSGAYVRSTAHFLGEQIKMGAIALKITRQKIGKYSINQSLRLL